jgi:hypothetical protein
MSKTLKITVKENIYELAKEGRISRFLVNKDDEDLQKAEGQLLFGISIINDANPKQQLKREYRGYMPVGKGYRPKGYPVGYEARMGQICVFADMPKKEAVADEK